MYLDNTQKTDIMFRNLHRFCIGFGCPFEMNVLPFGSPIKASDTHILNVRVYNQNLEYTFIRA